MHQEEIPPQQPLHESPTYEGVTAPSQPESLPISQQPSNQGDDNTMESTPSPSPPSADRPSGAGRQRSKSGTGHLTMQQLNKKRQRATPEQLVVLEEAFILNPSPNAKMREMIADRIRMTERSVQIWFQNRRAKMKQMQRKEVTDDSGLFFGMNGSPGVMDQMKRNVLMRSNSVGGHGGQYGALPPDIKYGLRMGSWNGPLTPAASPSSKTTISRLAVETLSIGDWHRIACSAIDLVCYYSASEGRFTYYINNSSAGFKIEFPIQLVKGIKMEHMVRKVTTEAGIATPGREQVKHRARIMIELLQAPSFYSEIRSSGGWQLCHDFTQGLVASRIFLHTLVGPYDQLHAQMNEAAAMSPEFHSRLWMDDKPQFLANDEDEQYDGDEDRGITAAPGVMGAPQRPASTIPAQFVRQHLTPNAVPQFNTAGTFGPRGARPLFAHRRTRSRSLPTAINVSELAIAASQHQLANTLVPGMKYAHDTNHLVPMGQEMMYSGHSTPLRIDTSVADSMDYYRQFTPSSNISSLTPVDYVTSPASQIPLPSSLPFYEGSDYSAVNPGYAHAAVYPTENIETSAIYAESSPMMTMDQFHPHESYTYTADPVAMQETPAYTTVPESQWTSQAPQVMVTSQMDVEPPKQSAVPLETDDGTMDTSE